MIVSTLHPLCRWLSLPLFMSAMTIAAPSAGQTDPARAKALFEEGREAIEAGELDTACRKFADSQALDAHVGTVLNWALCEEKRGRLADALRHWQEAERLARERSDERLAVAKERGEQLAARVPRLTLRVADDAPAGTRVWIERAGRDPLELTGENLERPIPLDPGDVAVIARAEGYGDKRYRLTLAEGARETLEVAPESNGNARDVIVDDSVTSQDGVSPLIIVGAVAGGLGLVGIGVGAGFGAMAKSKQKESNAGPCNETTNICNASGIDLRKDAIGAATVSTAMFIAGGVLVAVGVTLIAVGASSGGGGEQVSMGVGAGSLSLRGRF